MHALSHVSIVNYRSCKKVELPLGDFTPVVGYNNAGKSNILSAIEWLIEPSSLMEDDFFIRDVPVVVAGTINGISDELIGKMPSNQQRQIRPYILNGEMRFRRILTSPGGTRDVELQVLDPKEAKESEEKAWGLAPVGIPQALKALFPETIRVHAMQDAADDVAKQAKGNTIGKLIADVIEPVRKHHENELREALKEIGEKFSADGAKRAQQLKEFDDGATKTLSDLFPGLQLKLDVPLPEIADLFKNGSVRIVEEHGSVSRPRAFTAVGHGAQRCIQMALIRFLAEKDSAEDTSKRKLLLIDEPELYLHPQGIEHVRLALKKLSSGRYQVIYSTHSPIMLHRDDAPHAVMVRKPNNASGTQIRKPLARAVSEVISDAGHATRVVFDLGTSAQVFFSDRVLLSEGKTEQVLLPLLYESYLGKAPRADRTGIVSLGGCANFHNTHRVLDVMGVQTRIVADLDYVFSFANKLVGNAGEPDRNAVSVIFSDLQRTHSITVVDGLPVNGKNGGLSAAEAWSEFAKDPRGAAIAKQQHDRLKAHGVWVWQCGTIEDALGITAKGEDIVQQLEQSVPKLSAADIEARYSPIADFLKWLAQK